jgi:hypothetical protein
MICWSTLIWMSNVTKRYMRRDALWVEMALVGIDHGRQFEHFSCALRLFSCMNKPETHFWTHFLCDFSFRLAVYADHSMTTRINSDRVEPTSSNDGSYREIFLLLDNWVDASH